MPRQFLSTSNVRDTTVINSLTANVTNPFAGLIPGETLNNATTQRQNLLRPYPQFGNVDVRRYDGSSRFDSAQFRLERRFSGGYNLQISYTWSNFKEQVTKLNDTDTDYEERYQDTHLPHRLVMNGIWELPFGHGRRFGSGANALTNAIIGNWSVSAIWNWQSGRPNISDGQRLLRRRHHAVEDVVHQRSEPAGVRHQRLLLPRRRGPDQRRGRPGQAARRSADPPGQQRPRRCPSRWNGLRGPRYTNWDMSFVKGFEMGRVRAQLHLELYNAFNDVFYNNPNLDPTSANFGLVTSQNNLPRNFQIGTKIVF